MLRDWLVCEGNDDCTQRRLFAEQYLPTTQLEQQYTTIVCV